MTPATWYVLVDGRVVDPAEVSPDQTGALMHASGVAVATSGGVPRSRGVDLDAMPADPKPERQTYSTRQMRAK